MPLERSWLYAPATRPELVRKALAGAADGVVVDLEDAVPPGRKAEGRALAAELLRAGAAGRSVEVRINGARTDDGEADVAALTGIPGIDVRVPKVEGPEDVERVVDWLEAAGSDARVACLVETALGVERAYEIAAASPRVTRVELGEGDLGADLGVTDDAGLAWARSRIVVAARAAGLAPPVQAVWTDLRDTEGLRRTSEEGRAWGFFGRSCIHPAQVPVVNEAYTPTVKEVARAREIVAALAAAEQRRDGALVLPDGRFVDLAVVEAARRTLEISR